MAIAARDAFARPYRITMFGPTLGLIFPDSPDCPVVDASKLAGCGPLNNDAPLNTIGSYTPLLGGPGRPSNNSKNSRNKYQPAKCVGRPAKCVEQPARAAAKLLRIDTEPPLLESSRKPCPEGQGEEEEDFGLVFRDSQHGSGSRDLAALSLRAFHSSIGQVRPKKASAWRPERPAIICQQVVNDRQRHAAFNSRGRPPP